MAGNLCERCAWTYPYWVGLSPVVGSLVKGDVCGICALEIVNAVHATRKRTFSEGSRAEEMRLDALDTRADGSASAPPDDSDGSAKVGGSEGRGASSGRD